MSHANEPPPAFRAPPLACDSHFHVFGPAERYPYGAGAERPRYAMPVAPLSDYLDLARHLGIERFVFVQPSAYGRDNACMLDAMREVGNACCRGIVDVDEDTPDALLADLHRLGVRGVRINVSPVKPPEPGFGASMVNSYLNTCFPAAIAFGDAMFVRSTPKKLYSWCRRPSFM